MSPPTAYEERPATYEIQLHARPPDALVRTFASMRVRRLRTHTVLVGQVESQRDLDALLDRLFAIGAVLAEVHELVPATRLGASRSPRRSYEVRVDGELDARLLHHLSWKHSVVPERSAVCVDASPDDMHAFLSACFELGLGVDRVRRIRPTGRQHPAGEESRSAGS